MRMAGATALLVLVVELLVALGFLAGWYWVGGLRGGLVLGGLVLLLIVLPWLGELTVRFDSAGPAAAVGLSWWGRFSFRETPEATLITVRVLGIPFRRDKPKPPAEEPPVPSDEEPTAPEPAALDEVAEEAPTPAAEPAKPSKAASFLRHVNADTAEGVTRMALAGLSAANDLFWGAREITVRLDDMSGHEVADRALARVIGARELGPLSLLMMTGDGNRRVRLRYRIGMLRVALNGLQVFAEGRPLRLKAALAEPPQSPEDARRAEDEELIQAIIEAREDE